VSFTATVTGVSPTGTVQFNIDGSAFGSPVTLASGTATSGTTSTLSAGTHTVTAVYSGDTNNAGGTGTLAGGQVVSSLVAASPTSVNFGKAWVGLGAHHDVTVSNNGATNVVVGPITFTNVTGNPGDFSDHSFCTIPLKPGKSCLVDAKFMPSSKGTETATMTIYVSGVPLQVSLTGTGKVQVK
jgi:hypothetical protein